MKFLKIKLESILLILILIGIAAATNLALENQNLQKYATPNTSCNTGDCFKDCICRGRPGTICENECSFVNTNTGGGGGGCKKSCKDKYGNCRPGCGGGGGGGGGNNNPPPPPPPLPTSPPNGPCSDSDSDDTCKGKLTGEACSADQSVLCTNYGGIKGTDEQLVCYCGAAPTAAPEIIEPTAAPTPTDIPAGTLTIAVTVESPPENDFPNLFSKLRLYVKEAGSVTSTPIEIPNSSLSPNTPYITTVENKDPLLNYEVYLEFADSTGTKFQFEGQTIEAKYTVYGIDYPCDAICNLDSGLYPNMNIDFKITLPPSTQNLVGQESNNSILAVLGNWISGTIDRLNFLNFLKQIKDPPGLKKSTCDPSVPPYCKPVFN